MSAKTIDSSENTKLKNKRKKNPALIYNYLDTLEDGTRICKVCEKNKSKWGSLTSLMPITCHFKKKHPNTFKEFGKSAAKFVRPSP
ncbi:4617_t:CDS:1, partial [Scutellospora calospora]